MPADPHAEAEARALEALEKHFRFGAFRGKRRSHIWSCFTYGNDLYLAQDIMGKWQKISLHKSGVFRLAFHEEGHAQLVKKGLFPPERDRVVTKWRRKEASDSPASLVVSILFPERHLAMTDDDPLKRGAKILWEAMPNGAVEIGIFHSESFSPGLEEALSRAGRPVWYSDLGAAGVFSLVIRHRSTFDIRSVFPNGKLTVPATAIHPEERHVSERDRVGTLAFNDAAKAGFLQVWELGAGKLTRD